MYKIQEITRNLEINWNGKLRPKNEKNIFHDIVEGLWDAIEDYEVDKQAEKFQDWKKSLHLHNTQKIVILNIYHHYL